MAERLAGESRKGDGGTQPKNSWSFWGRTQKETRSIRFVLTNALTWLKSLSANPTNTHQLFPSSSSQGLALSKFPFVRRPFSLRREKSDRERLWSKKLDRQEETAEGKRQPRRDRGRRRKIACCSFSRALIFEVDLSFVHWQAFLREARGFVIRSFVDDDDFSSPRRDSYRESHEAKCEDDISTI